MKAGLRSLVVCSACCLAGLAVSPVAALGEGTSSSEGSGASPFGSALVVSGSPTEAEQAAAEKQAKLASPEAVAEREASTTKFENLNPEQAATTAGEAFPALITEPAGGPPRLPTGQRITGYVTPNTAQVDLGGGEHGLVLALDPMAIEAPHEGWLPVDLGLSEKGGAFESANPLVAVRIPKRLGEGVAAAASGISVTPVDAQGSPLSGSEGTVDGATVFYANTLTDTDTIAKPSTFGFAVDTVLRSTNAPEQLSFRVGLPEGASLVQTTDAPTAVQVVKEGVTIATVPAPVAQDAAGTAAPVSMSVSGNTLTLTVDHRSHPLRYPVEVDPEFNTGTDSTLTSQTWRYGNGGAGWHYSEPCCQHEQSLYHNIVGSSGEWAQLYYKTEGDSKIYKVNTVTTVAPTAVESELLWYAEARAYLEFEGAGGYENSSVIAQGPGGIKEENGGINSQACAAAECSPANGGEHNLVRVVGQITGSFNAEDVNLGLKSATVSISQPKETHPTISYNKSSAEIGGTPNVFYAGGWLGPNSGAFEFHTEDLGIGIAETRLEWLEGSTWTHGSEGTKKYLGTSSCVGIQCTKSQGEAFNYANLLNKIALNDGEEHIRVAADDAIEHTWSSEHGEGEMILKVDKTAPHGFTLTGLAGKEASFELGEVEAHVKAEATDGEGSVPSSGIQSISLGIDGKEFGKPSGSCLSGPCTAAAEWAINGAELGVGEHTLTVTATDKAGNVASKPFTLTVYHASPVAVGPGSVNPESGDFALGATDVNMSGGAGALAVTRHYDSRNLQAGAEGPLGPQWSVSLGSLASLEVLPDNSVMVIGPEGLTHFSKSGGALEAPKGDKNLTLELKGSEYLLKDATKGTTTRFTLPAGAKSWMPTVSEGPVSTNTMTDTYVSVEPEAGKTIVEPKLELAPHASASCPAGEPTKWERGCRGLEFTYATSTSAAGENESEWGEYKARLMKVLLRAYNPTTKAIEAKTVAEYAYDKLGRLRAEWDPRVQQTTDCGKECPVLKTLYGYDGEGHVVALTPPGQETWAFTYGTIPSDSSSGRLLKATRASASAPLWNGKATSDTNPPKISGTPAVGLKMGIAKGEWSNNPVAFGYQWEDCNQWTGKECTPILGATNPNYTPTESDLNHRLVVYITAVNGGGAFLFTTPASAYVETGQVWTYLTPEHGPVDAITAGPDKNIWYSEPAVYGTKPPTLSKMATVGSPWTEYTLPSKEEDPYAITSGPDGNMWFTEHEKGKFGKMTTTGTRTTYELNGLFANPGAITAGSDGNLWFTGNNKIIKSTTAGSVTEYSLPSGSGPTGIAAGPDKNVWFTNHNSSKVSKITPTGTITEYALTAGAGPEKIVAGPDGNLWLTERTASMIAKITTSGAITTYALPTGSEPRSITSVGGALWFSEMGTGKIGKITTSGTITEFREGSGGHVPVEVAAGPDGWLWFTESESQQINKLNPSPPEGEALPPEPGTTIEYKVPLSGTGLPTMNGPTPAKWGQTDRPAYAAAIFPPDEPQGWPASGYKRATISYMDNQARTVNVAAPSGGISTREYNTENAVTRSLGADARAAALKEANSGEVSKLLDTKNAYGTAGQLTDTWGPQHTVKLVKGKEGKSEEALARNHIKYFYNEGAAEVEAQTHESYELVTKTEDGAETASKEEFDKRTATTSYGGQSNLGWKLRSPTSTTTDAGGLNLTNTTKYDEGTGNVIETKTPAGAGGDASVPPAYSFAFGSGGSGSGQLNGPTSDATDASGNLWVVDANNNRVDEFSSAGAFVKTLGFGVSDGKEALEVCTSSCRAGIAGAGQGQFNAPWGIAINQSTGNVYVGDSANNRVEELSAAGAFIAVIGTKGTGEGQLLGATGIAIDAIGNVWVADSGNNRVEEFSAGGTYKAVYGKTGTGNGEFNAPEAIAISGGNLYVTDSGNNRVQELSASGTYLGQFGAKGSGTGQFNTPIGITTNPSNGNLYITDSGNKRVEEFTASRAYLAQFGTQGAGNGQFSAPEGITSDSSGNLYVVDAASNERIQKWAPTVTGNVGAHEGKTIYYTAKAEAEVETCRNHPEWIGLPCETKLGAQPGTSGLPALPVTTIEYNMLNQPEKIEEAFGTGAEAKTRLKKTTYDAAGRPQVIEETASLDIVLPKVTNTYSPETGALVEQSTTVGETTKALKSAHNTVGELTEYTDATGNKATFEYEKEKDVRLLKVADAKGSQTYHYDETTGNLTELVDSAAGAFKATYDVAGKMTSETYPNAMNANYARNPVGTTTGIEYTKTAHCAKTCPEVWFGDATVPSVHGEVLKQASTLSEEASYTYDAVGRLTQVQEIPTGQGCTTRSYTYDEESNRATLTTSKPGTEEKCVSEGGSTEWHTYDTANRITDPGTAYESFGNTTKVPALDAGGSELTSEYYVDSQVAKQEQNKETIEYKLDPEDRTMETISKGNTNAILMSHYGGAGSALAWTSEGSGETEKWARNIPGIDGTLSAVQEGEGKTSKSVVLQLHDLQGNVVGEARDNEAETKLLKSYNSTEFGVPSNGAPPPKYAWLGAAGVGGELPSGVITQDGVTYVPQTGRPLQTEGVALASITNSATPFTRPVEAWVGSKAGEGAARELSKAEQERREREAANKPPGVTPPGNPGFCGGEYGPCGREGIEGSEDLSGGCLGEGACASASAPSCSVNMLMAEPSGNVMVAVGKFHCSALTNFQLEICIEAPTKIGGSQYRAIECNKEGNRKGEIRTRQDVGSAKTGIFCATGISYEAWVWGYAFGPGYGYGTKGKATAPYACEGTGTADAAEELIDFAR